MKLHYLSSYYNYTVGTLIFEKFIVLSYLLRGQCRVSNVRASLRHFSIKFLYAFVTFNRNFKLYSISSFKFLLSNVITLLLMEQSFFFKFSNTFSRSSIASFGLKKRQKLGFLLHLRGSFLLNFISIFSLFTVPIIFQSMFESSELSMLHYQNYVISYDFNSYLFHYQFGFSEISRLFNSVYYINCFSYYYVFDINGFCFSLFTPIASPFYGRFIFSLFEIYCY